MRVGAPARLRPFSQSGLGLSVTEDLEDPLPFLRPDYENVVGAEAGALPVPVEFVRQRRSTRPVGPPAPLARGDREAHQRDMLEALDDVREEAEAGPVGKAQQGAVIKFLPRSRGGSRGIATAR